MTSKEREEDINKVEKKIKSIKEEISREKVNVLNITNLSDQDVADIVMNRSKKFYTMTDNTVDIFTRLFLIMALKQMKSDNIKAIVYVKEGHEVEITKKDRFWWTRSTDGSAHLVIEQDNSITAVSSENIIAVKIVYDK